MALENGFDVVLDKPMTFSLDEAKELRDTVQRTGRILALTHTYSGYPAVKEAKERIARGDFGKIRKIYTEYPQGWLSDRAELDPTSNAGWRTDPTRSGKAGCMGDIGTHALHLAEYISGLKCQELCADVKTFVEGRLLDDDGAALLRFENGVSGVLVASQVCAGEENSLFIRIYGEKGGIEWHQMEPNTLVVKWPDRPAELVRTGNGYMGGFAKANTRTPGGHPEGYIEAFANIYRNFARTVLAVRNGEEPKAEWLDFPGVEDGVRGMQFIETVITSGHDQETKWLKWVE
jgi:predicted dehydrogenase